MPTNEAMAKRLFYLQSSKKGLSSVKKVQMTTASAHTSMAGVMKDAFINC